MFIVLSNRQSKDWIRISPDEQKFQYLYIFLQKCPNMRMMLNVLQSDILLILEAVGTSGVRIVTRRHLFNLVENFDNQFSRKTELFKRPSVVARGIH